MVVVIEVDRSRSLTFDSDIQPDSDVTRRILRGPTIMRGPTIKRDPVRLGAMDSFTFFIRVSMEIV
jgi:hypothetical protein